MQMETINIQDLTPAEYNPRIMPPSEMQKLKKGLTTYGLIDPIIIDLTDNNTVIGGHQRLEALKEIQEDQELQLIRLGDIGLVLKETHLKIKDKNDQKAINLALNKISGDWDYQKLDDILMELQEDNYIMDLTGFDEELEELMQIDLSPQEDPVNPLDVFSEKNENETGTDTESETIHEKICPTCGQPIQKE